MKVDDREVIAALKRVRMTKKNLTDIATAGSMQVSNHQKEDVPVDTAATRNSIFVQTIVATARLVSQHIGPTTFYAPFIEFGTSNPNYPIQAFVRPSVFGSNQKRVLNTMEATFFRIFLAKVKGSLSRAGF